MARSVPSVCLAGMGQRPLPAGPTPTSSANLLFSQFKVLLNFFQKIAVSKGSEATEVWVPDQTSGTQAPFFGGLLGPTVRSAASAATPPQFALRARGRRPLPAGPSLPGWVPLFSKTKVLLDFFQKIAVSKGSEATEVWVPAQTSGAQAPFFGGLLGLSARSALRATPPQFALRARGRRPLPVGPSLPGWVPLFSKIKVLLDFFQKIAVSKGRAFGRSSQ